MKVTRFVNSIFTSNSYILDFEGDNGIWIIDPGDSKPIIQWLEKNKKYLNGILITHSHFDHIYGVNDLYDLYPEVRIYASKYAIEGMYSAKLNCSYYTENPYVVDCQHINIAEEPNKILLSGNIYANVIHTPGHNRDCLSYLIEDNLFTGDALIPGIKVVTKSKHSNKAEAINSVNRIFVQFTDETMIYPGHETNLLLADLKCGL
ncbi:MAG: MBL fold metallo-hydrolase [Bacteroidales bacterium]|nr:MBL fold metallo-hydrolase [Bacteroidales bacterium]